MREGEDVLPARLDVFLEVDTPTPPPAGPIAGVDYSVSQYSELYCSRTDKLCQNVGGQPERGAWILRLLPTAEVVLA